ncbi:multidrug resistance-associated protein 1-like [Ornithodoros turicata]|uniref:multidrug resistance-associated protein 1-like n=1 Tax=Ornithodoros turicata TaxID=34597 RepID=UPI0031396798
MPSIFQASGYCEGPFWDPWRTWYTDVPELTPCFENTVLLWIPVVVLWAIAPFHILKRRWEDTDHLRLTLLAVLKYVFTVCLLLTSVVGFVVAVSYGAPGETVTAHALKTISFLTVYAIQRVDRKHGVTSSPLLFTFWLVLAICELPAYYRMLVNAFGRSEHQPPSPVEFATHTLAYPIVFFQLLLFSIGESTGKNRSQKACPVEHASPMSFIIFEWMTPLIWKGYKKVLTISDLYIIPKTIKSSANFKLWKTATTGSEKVPPPLHREEQEKHTPFIARKLMRVFWKQILVGCIVELSFILCRITPALLLDRIIQHLHNTEEQAWKGYLYALSIFLMNSLSTMFVRHGDVIFIGLGLRVKAVLLAAVYRKALRISGAAMGKYTVGELINLLSVDADKVNQLSSYIGIAVGAPVNIAYSTYLLWHFLGPSCLAGIFVIVIMMPITGTIAQRCRKLQERQMQLKDSRLKQMGEILTNMKILKLYAWELPFIKKARNIRFSEMEILKRFAYWTATMRFCWTSTPFLVSLFAFIAFIYSGRLTVLDANIAFVSLTLFNGMRFALTIIPDLVSNVVQTAVSIKRIEEFLLSEELDPNVVGNQVDEGEAVSFRDATLSWSNSEYRTLSSIDLSVKRGQLVAIVGQVGSGKSSLLSAILGDLLIEEGAINVKGSIAYVPQTAWILNCTIRQNILFTKHYSHSLYNRVLDACCLRPDLQTIPGGEMTEIGEKGVNLSGGQKQRISLARAVYQDKDIYLLDDPLSAVDSHVGGSIFDDVIGPKGLLRRKTRILVTNSLSVLSEVDVVVYLQGGRIVESGTYKALIKSGKHFAEFVKEHVNFTEGETSEEESSSVLRHRTISEYRLDSSKSESQHIDEPHSGFQLLQEETVQTGSVKIGVYMTYLKNVGLQLIVATLVGFAASRAFDIGANLWLSEWNKDARVPEDNRYPGFRLGIYAVLGFCQGIFSFIGTAALANGTVRAARRLHDRMLGAVVRAPMSFFDTTPLGRILNRFGKDVDQLDIQLPVMANLFLELLFQLIGALMLMSAKMPLFLLGAIPLLYFYFFIQKIYLQTLRQVKRMESVTRSPVYNHFSETLSGLSSIRGYVVEKEFTDRFETKVDITQNCSYLLVVARMWMTARLDTIGNIVVLLVTLMVISQRGVIDDGLGGLLVSYVMASCYAFNFLVHYAAEMETAVVASERLEEYSTVTSEAPWKIQPGPESKWPREGEVTFEGYSTRYRRGLDLVLCGVDLAIHPGERIGVVGRTGAGKSSLTLSLFRIIESAGGKISIDGVDISSVGLHDLRSRLGIIPQDPVLFSGTLRFNLDPNGDYDDSNLWAALERAHVKEHFPGGLETQINEGGQNISLGQRQLVCLARAVLKKSKILVLDEATAAVDLETDSLIQDTICRDFVGSTIITIAHRLHTVMDSDRIIVMANGMVTEEGSPSDLLLNPASQFASMAREAGITLNTDS